jgi:hypothetical protein
MTTALPTKEAAAQAETFLADEVFVPALFEKLAEYDITPSTEEEASQLIQLGAMLQQAEGQGTFKAAQAPANSNAFLTQAIDKLAYYTQEPATPANVGLAVAQANPLAKSAATIYQYLQSGGALSD